MTARKPKPNRVERDYASEHGHDALREQARLAATRCPHCWQPNGLAHHPLCPNTPPDTSPPTQEEALF